MALFLAELPTPDGQQSALQSLFDKLDDAVKQAGGEVIEVQVGKDLERAYLVIEHGDQAAVQLALIKAGAPPTEVAPVRLVGAALDEVKASKGGARYLVEWDLPEGLTMERYLERKKANSPKYADVPEVRFLRTYVREDMMKCLCFYDASNEQDVLRAREAVSAPVDRVTRLDQGGA